MKKKIILHGHLREKYPHEILVEASTVAEAIRSLQTIDELTPTDGTPWPVTVQGVDSDVALYSQTSLDEIHVYPRLEGGGGVKRFFQIIVGVVLIAVGVVFAPALAGGFITGGTLVTAGAMMVLGGILQLLVPTPEEIDVGEGSNSSRYLGATGNTVQIGTRIPLAYGNNKIAGHYLSFDVDAKEWAGDANPVAGSGAATVVDNSVYVEHDKTDTNLVPVNPVFSSSVAGPGNVPTAGWTA